MLSVPLGLNFKGVLMVDNFMGHLDKALVLLLAAVMNHLTETT